MPTKKKKPTPTKTSQAKSLKKLLFDPKTFARASTGTKVVCVLVALAVVYFLMAAINFAIGKVDFHELGRRVDYVQEQVPVALKRQVTMTRSKSCFYNEQRGDFDKGKLYCGITLNGKYAASNGSDLGNTHLLIQEITAKQWAFGTLAQDTPDISSDRTYRNGYTICSLQFDSNIQDSSSQVPLKESFRVSCSTRASHQYYPLED